MFLYWNYATHTQTLDSHMHMYEHAYKPWTPTHSHRPEAAILLEVSQTWIINQLSPSPRISGFHLPLRLLFLCKIHCKRSVDGASREKDGVCFFACVSACMYIYAYMCAYDYECNALTCVWVCVFSGGWSSVSFARCAHWEVVSSAWGGAGERAGRRPGAKERGHIHIHRIGHAHVNHF